MGKSKGRSARIATEEDETGDVQEFEGKLNVERAIFDRIHIKRFYTAEQAPICKGPMQEIFGYLATTITVRQVLEGSYDYPEWFGQATEALCEECAQIRLGAPARSVDTTIR